MKIIKKFYFKNKNLGTKARPTHCTPDYKTTIAAARQAWDAQMQAALATGQRVKGELLEGFSDAVFEDAEWQW